MSEGYTAPPIKGYRDVSGDRKDMVNENKEVEETILRKLDYLSQLRDEHGAPFVDGRWLAIARTHIEEGFMAMNRAIFRPQRIKLPGDDAHP